MSDSSRPPRVVAELGRPETPEETAERKARDSKLYRQRKTLNNLVLSLLVSLAMVVVIVLAVPRGNYEQDRSVDVATLAEQAQPTAVMPLAVPALGSNWRATQAEVRESPAEQVTFWYVGYIAPDEQFAAFKEAVGANPTWVATQLDNVSATGTETRSGVTWTVYDHGDRSADTTNVRFGYTTEVGEVTYVVYGTTSQANMQQLVDAITAQITEGSNA
jgi:hypothetical protein